MHCGFDIDVDGLVLDEWFPHDLVNDGAMLEAFMPIGATAALSRDTVKVFMLEGVLPLVAISEGVLMSFEVFEGEKPTFGACLSCLHFLANLPPMHSLPANNCVTIIVTPQFV